jgi:hypothetical protein
MMARILSYKSPVCLAMLHALNLTNVLRASNLKHVRVAIVHIKEHELHNSSGTAVAV